MKILSNKDIKEIELYTMAHEGVTSLQFIERASNYIASEIARNWRPNVSLMVFAGWGNNGADALEVSRLLAMQGFAPEVYLFNIGGNLLSKDCKTMRDKMLASGANIKFAEIDGKEPFSWPEPDSNTLIIDGIFGSGLDRPMPRPFQILAHNINDSGATVVSIDMPSGLGSDWNSHTSRQDMVHATLTLAIGFPRLSFFIADNAPVTGHWEVIDIGLSRQAIRQAPLTYFLVTESDVSRFLNVRGEFTSKADYGHALICAGSYGMMGAAVLAAEGCLRAGAGKVTVHAPSCGYTVMQSTQPSAMFDADAGKHNITAIPTDTRYTAICAGPGMGMSDATADALEKFLKAMSAASRPVVLDADALNIIAQRPTMLGYLPVLSVLTPHAGEFDRLFGEQPDHEARLRKAIEVSRYHQIIIVLKGRYTAIVRPDGKVFFNSSGSAALATGGTGDVLAGVITGFMASGLKPEIAALVGCYVHGVAGDMAEQEHSDIGVTSLDVARNIGRAIKSIARE